MDAPAPACLTVQPCDNYPCDLGARWDLASLPANSDVPHYGRPECQYYIIDIANSAQQQQAGSVTLRVAPLTQPHAACEHSELRVYVYGHGTSGLTNIPAMAMDEFPIHLQGKCALSDILEAFGGMPEYDRFRVLAGGIAGNGAQLPLSVSIDKANH
jgi:hypothetical protein